MPTENSIRVEGRNLVSRGGRAFAADVDAKLAASTWMLWRKPRNPERTIHYCDSDKHRPVSNSRLPFVRKHRRVSSGGQSLVAMVQSADLRHDDDPTRARRLDRTRLGAILLERQMGPGTVVIVQVGRQDPPKMALVQDDDVIQAFSPDRSDDSFGVGVLPRRSWRGQDFADVHGSQAIAEGCSIGAIAIPDEVSRGAVPWKRFRDLPRQPSRRGVLRYVEMNQPSPRVAQHDEGIE